MHIVVKRTLYSCSANLEKTNVISYIRLAYSFTLLFPGATATINSDFKKKLASLAVESVNICFTKC